MPFSGLSQKSAIEFADDHAGNHGFGNGVAAEAVEAVHIPAGSFTGSEQALQSLTGFARSWLVRTPPMV